MELLDQMSGSDFTNYFLAFPEEGCTKTAAEKKSTKLQREGILELCHNVRLSSLLRSCASSIHNELIMWEYSGEPRKMLLSPTLQETLIQDEVLVISATVRLSSPSSWLSA
jgi:hypothetical protein